MALIYHLDLYPENRKFNLEGSYTLVNDQYKLIKELLIQLPIFGQINYKFLSLNKAFEIDSTFHDHQLYKLVLTDSLMEDDSILFSFKAQYDGSLNLNYKWMNTDVIENGTMINHQYFPSIGYNSRLEMKSSYYRAQNGLKETKIRADSSFSILGDDAHKIRYEAFITSSDQ